MSTYACIDAGHVHSQEPAASLGSYLAPGQGQNQFQVQNVEKTHQEDHPSHGQQHLLIQSSSFQGMSLDCCSFHPILHKVVPQFVSVQLVYKYYN